MKEAMTTEEMNRVIKKYMNYGPLDARIYYRFDRDWNAIHDVWQKLRGELVDISTQKIELWLYRAVLNIKDNIGKAILDTDITTAHRLMVEAIELIKKQKEYGEDRGKGNRHL